MDGRPLAPQITRGSEQRKNPRTEVEPVLSGDIRAQLQKLPVPGLVNLVRIYLRAATPFPLKNL